MYYNNKIFNSRESKEKMFFDNNIKKFKKYSSIEYYQRNKRITTILN